jgi:hypothetical protein
MKVYIIQIESHGYECSYADTIKAFINKEKAQDYIYDLEFKSLMIREQIKNLHTDHKKNMDLLNSKNIQGKERLDKQMRLNLDHNTKKFELIQSAQEKNLILDEEREYYSILTLEVEE